ncbi:MAG: hypothetical protein IJV98_01840, partial [Clostridia bacterium]|nr:hypothetical protein [Clostridia bacterium]
ARQRINLAEITSYNVIAPESANDSGAFSGYGMGFYLVLTFFLFLIQKKPCVSNLRLHKAFLPIEKNLFPFYESSAVALAASFASFLEGSRKEGFPEIKPCRNKRPCALPIFRGKQGDT